MDEADHGGGIDAAVRQWGGTRADWIDLSTGINPCPYPVGKIAQGSWASLPDADAIAALESAARSFWVIPDAAAVVAAPGASALIAQIPLLASPGRVAIAAPTYNEHGRSFAAEGWDLVSGDADARVLVQPNNPDGRVWQAEDVQGFCIIDESFCDVMPHASLIASAVNPGVIILKSFGKFWGLAGLRLGFAIGDPSLIARLKAGLGPWAVSGPALEIGARALSDANWASATRAILAQGAARLDEMVAAPLVGGTDLFRLYDIGTAVAFRDHLARAHIWSRIFPYSDRWVRLGLPGTDEDWARLSVAMAAWRR